MKCTLSHSMNYSALYKTKKDVCAFFSKIPQLRSRKNVSLYVWMSVCVFVVIVVVKLGLQDLLIQRRGMTFS